MNFKQACEILDIGNTLPPTRDSFNLCLIRQKELVIEARRSGDNEKEVVLNEVKAFLKAKLRKEKYCISCGIPIGGNGIRCFMCSNTYRHHSKAIMENGHPVLYKIEEGVVVPPHRIGELEECMQQLTKVGQSFVTDVKQCTITTKSKQLGIQVIMRKLDKKITVNGKERPLFRVWRSDGLKYKELNQLITSNAKPK